jgi:uncharacterized circularly permuted ATP-grasp superfamily protein
VQRVKAINMFLHDVYHQQRILKAGLIPAEQVLAKHDENYMPPEAAAALEKAHGGKKQ